MSIWIALAIGIWSIFGFEVKKWKGDVHVLRDGEKVTPSKKMKLMSGDVIVTGKRSKMLIKNSSQQVWVGQKTQFQLRKLMGGGESGVLNLLYGKFRAQVQKSSDKKTRFKYQVDTAVAGVRGTEFFIEKTRSKKFVCTLEGEVAVTLEDGKEISVKEGQGLNISDGEVPHLEDNSSYIVDRWVAETSFDQSAIYEAYGFERPLKKTSPMLSVGGQASLYACDSYNFDFNSSQSDADRYCLRGYFSPYLKYGQSDHIYFRPALVTNHLYQDARMDNHPVTVATRRETLTLPEFYAGMDRETWLLRVGFQEIQWHEGSLLSAKRWSSEPVTHSAIRWKGRNLGGGFDVMLSARNAQTQPLDGYSRANLMGLRWLFPKQRGSVYVLNAKMGQFQSDAGIYFSGRDSQYFGLYFKEKWGNWDLRAIYNHLQHQRIDSGLDDRIGDSDHFWDLKFGHVLGRLQFSLRALEASENYFSVHEDYYELGMSFLFPRRINLRQIRAKAQWSLSPDQHFFLEYLQHSQVSPDGVFVYSSKDEEFIGLGQEWNVGYHQNWESWSVFGALWQLDPYAHWRPDPGYGILARIEYRYH